jgi:hypothetical protein
LRDLAFRIIARRMRTQISTAQVFNFIDGAIEGDLHAKRIESLAIATHGIIQAGSLAVSAIGRAIAVARGTKSKHAIKQVDRLLSNRGVNLPAFFAHWVLYILAERQEAIVALDWTDFDHDDQSTLALHLVTSHGRTTPLLWRTVRKSELEGWRNVHEDRLLLGLRELVPEHIKVTVLADRGFGDCKFYALLNELKFGFVVRFREGIQVADATGEMRPASEWVPSNGRPRLIVGATVTGEKMPVPAVVCVKKKGMKDAWCLAVGDTEMTGAEAVELYGKRFRIEESFRDIKDIRFGMGLSQARIDTPERRDRLLLLGALAVVLLTLLGAAGEKIGMDRHLKANTVKKRTHSLIFQGSHYYQAIPMMKEKDLVPLIEAFVGVLAEQRVLREVFGVI